MISIYKKMIVFLASKGKVYNNRILSGKKRFRVWATINNEGFKQQFFSGKGKITYGVAAPETKGVYIQIDQYQ